MRITCDSTAGVIIDVQQRLLPVMYDRDRTLEKIVTLIRGLRILGVPFIATEQYPKGLGPSVDAVMEALAEPIAVDVIAGAGIDGGDRQTEDDRFSHREPQKPMVKSAFSCCDDEPFTARLSSLGRKTILIAGIEAHVCVLQTTVDLLERGYRPVVVADAVSSRRIEDRDTALRRMEREGALLTTVESILFELTRISGTPRFKAISKLIK